MNIATQTRVPSTKTNTDGNMTCPNSPIVTTRHPDLLWIFALHMQKSRVRFGIIVITQETTKFSKFEMWFIVQIVRESVRRAKTRMNTTPNDHERPPPWHNQAQHKNTTQPFHHPCRITASLQKMMVTIFLLNGKNLQSRRGSSPWRNLKATFFIKKSRFHPWFNNQLE